MTRTEELVKAIQAGQTRAVVARIYAKGIADSVGGLNVVDWPTVNGAALKRWKPSGLNWIKKMAWRLYHRGERSI